MPKIISDKTRLNIVNYYKSKPMTINECAEYFSICAPSVMKILDEYHIDRYNKVKINSPYLKEDFFSVIDTLYGEFKAYFIGLIITDGNIYTDNSSKQYSISITLHENDDYILESFLDILNSNNIVAHDGRGCSQAAIRSNIMTNDLSKYGIYPNKTLSTRLPMFENQTIMSWLIRGILDGDGSIGFGLTSQNRWYHAISFCGSKELMTDIRDYLSYTLNLTYVAVYSYSDRHLSEIKYQSLKDIQILGNWIYQYPMQICMYRKYIKFLELKSHFNLY